MIARFGVTLVALSCMLAFAGTLRADEEEPPWVRNRREAKDKAGGLPPAVLAKQSTAKVRVPTLGQAVQAAQKAAGGRHRDLVRGIEHGGRRMLVPDTYASIQAALDAAVAGDVVAVRPGTYRELLTMKEGVKLVSDAGEGGDKLVSIEGARIKLPARALRTVLDGTGTKPSRHGIIDFRPGTSRRTVVDGFTIQNLPKQNHHLPGHAHALNVRGASPVVMNCLIRNNGSTGIGNHVVYKDQDKPIDERDFRTANVLHEARALIYNNVVHNNLGRGIGCNHLSAPLILGNEVFDNDDAELGEPTGPGIGMKHGAAPLVVGNVVHGNPGGGILGRVGAPQGRHPIDRPPRPTFLRNVVYGNGKQRPALGISGGGTRTNPVRFASNVVLGAGGVGIGLSDGSVCVVVDNIVASVGLQGIAVSGSTALKLNGNGISKAGVSGIAIVRGSTVLEMVGNGAEKTQGPRFLVRASTITAP